MYITDWRETVTCRDCGCSFIAELVPTFECDNGELLCLSCGQTRGGAYDLRGHCWTRVPGGCVRAAGSEALPPEVLITKAPPTALVRHG